MGSFSIDNVFYCIKCGNKGIGIARARSKLRGKFHRKKLYCCYCKEEVNHIECRNPAEVEEFLENFKNGVYVDEAEASVAHIRNTRIW